MALSQPDVNAGAAALGNIDPETVGNREDVEFQWAVKAYHHAETYDNLLAAVDPSFLKLTRIDDEIYTLFREQFPDFNVKMLFEPDMKSLKAKEQWRAFCNNFEKTVQDFNMGTLIRIDSSQPFSESNSIFVVRVQFLAIEIARNREGHNTAYKESKKTKS